MLIGRDWRMLPAESEYSVLEGLGYAYFGENTSGVRGVLSYNLRSSRGELKAPAPWSVRRGGIFSKPNDRKLAEYVYRFQHDYQNCPGADKHQSISSTAAAEAFNVTRKIDYCKNRDGIIGAATICQIARAISTNMPFWGKFWAENLDLKTNLKFYASGKGSEKGCSFRCSQVACNKRRVTNCPACGDPAAANTSTGAHGESNDGQQSNFVAPPSVAVLPGGGGGGSNASPAPSEGGFGLLIGALVIGGAAWYFLKKK